MTITNVRTRDFRQEDFDDAELHAMQADEGTSAVMNEVRKDAGLTSRGVAIRGDDVTNAELKARWVDEDVANQKWTKETHAREPELLNVAEFAYDALKTLNRAELHGEELARGSNRAAMHWALTSNVALPEGYAIAEHQRWQPDAGGSYASAASRMETRLFGPDQAKTAVLQLHADRGMSAAKVLLERGAPVDDASLAKNAPDVAKRRAEDPAYKVGFDALVWAEKNNPASYDATLRRLGEREARYAQHAVRG